jgi:hypothetical protein
MSTGNQRERKNRRFGIMNKTWKSQVGGILAIVGGVIGLLGCMGLLIAITVLGTVWQWGLMPVNVIGILWIILVPMFICGVTAIIGGIFAIQRKYYGMALTGAIAALFPAAIFGLGAIVFTAISRDEFGTEIKQEVKQVTLVQKAN